MKYDSSYIESNDIDWFFKCGYYYVHVASAGGVIPDVINVDRDYLRNLQYRVAMLPDVFSDEQIKVNTDYLNQILNVDIQIMNYSPTIDYYKESFVQMSRKGFISLDRTNINDLTDNTYHMVCRPPRRVALDDIDDLLPKIAPEKINLEGFINDLDLLEMFGD